MLRASARRLAAASSGSASRWSGQVMVDVCVVPLGKEGTSVRKEVAAVEKLLRRYEAEGKVTCRLHGFGTNVQGHWDDVMAAVKEAHEMLHNEMDVPRITCSWRTGTRIDKAQSIDDKVAAVEDELKNDKGRNPE
eukprot:gnl/TRDRNA2_/TRDRNA2_87848_c0_seq1.p1 gnl/TRDRNA2_/TRDRNA2_87848_c0~~gnl/TRDRNA2_/TRDRNA2_87848_c0_seq1.p1  ORF type:complete len:135 (-),score=39.05 gnl/TRDRNA2_/TRDRNA2_87848_c0_seq1:89-493(-)